MQPYRTLAAPATATITEKKSEFIAAVAPAATDEEAEAFLEQVRARHRTARHNVYAYVLRAGERTRYSDDGEPPRTAGLPVLEVLRHAQLLDVACVVTRYFGGVLLGTGGLVRAYTQAAQAALAGAKVVCMRPCVRMQLQLPYALHGRALALAEAAGARVEQTVYGEQVLLGWLVAVEAREKLAAALGEVARGQAALQVSEPFYAPL